MLVHPYRAVFQMNRTSLASRRIRATSDTREVSLLVHRETESTNPVVVRHHVRECCHTAVVEVRRVLPQVHSLGAPE